MTQIEENIYNLLVTCGRLTEAEIREELDISHGTFFAAKKTLLAAKTITATQEGKKLYYAACEGAQEARGALKEEAAPVQVVKGTWLGNDYTATRPAAKVSGMGAPAAPKPAPVMGRSVTRALFMSPDFKQDKETIRMTKVTGTFDTVEQFEDALTDELGNVTIEGDPTRGFVVICHDHDDYKQRYDSYLEDDKSFTVS